MAPQLSVQLKHCAVQCNNHWCQCNKLIMLQSKVVQRQKTMSSFSPYPCRSNDMGAFAGSHLKAELRKRPSYFEVLAASREMATFIVDCICTGSLLQ